MATVLPRPRSGRSAKALLLTVLGELVHPAGGEVWTATLIELLARLDVGEANTRQALTRLGDDGIVTAQRIGRATRWRLTAGGRRLLSAGAERIYGFGADQPPWDGQWVLAIVQIPEEQRVKRHHLRSQLAFAGFGFLGASTAVSPHAERTGTAARLLAGLELDPPGLVFTARSGAGVDDRAVIRRAWDLDSLSARYGAFIGGAAAARPSGDTGAAAALVALVHEWRRFPFDDPEIPAELLPSGWPGARAKARFDAARAAWSVPAHRWFAAAESGGG